VGVVALVGAIGGRLACGWACPFGLLQELLLRRRRRGKDPLPRSARLVKYAILAVFVIGLPLVLSYPSSPMFCKYICPAGTLEGGVPLVAHDRLSGNGIYPIGVLFAWKIFLMAAFLTGAALVSRFFCRTACPLGAAWGLFNRASLIALEVDKGACTRCGFCKAVCPMDIGVFENAGSAECIRCFKCTGCPSSAVRIVVRGITDGRGERVEPDGSQGPEGES
jgi:ferredoxin-type protein NapH